MRRLLTALGMAAWVVPAAAAGTSNSVILPQTPGVAAATFRASDTPGVFKTAYTAGPNGARCYGLVASSAGAAEHDVGVRIQHGPDAVYNSVIAVPIRAGGQVGNPIQPLMGTALTPGLMVDAYGNQFLQLAGGDALEVAFQTALTGSEILLVYGPCNDY